MGIQEVLVNTENTLERMINERNSEMENEEETTGLPSREEKQIRSQSDTARNFVVTTR